MLHQIDKLASPEPVQYTRPALLTALNDDQLQVRIQHEQAGFVMQARNALPDYQPQVGDEILVSGENFRCCYIIGVLQKVQTTQSLNTEQGAIARKQHKNGHETLSIEDEQGHLLFEYDATDRKSKLYAAQGDLSLTALQGDIELVSGNNIQCRSLGGLMMESATAAQIRVAGEDDQSSVSLTDKGLLLSSKKIGLKAESGQVKIEHCQYEGKSLKTVLDRSKLLIGKIETVATRIMQRAKNVYHQVEELQQTRANRVRTLVDETYHVKSKTTYIKSDKNVNIDGERIHLG